MSDKEKEKLMRARAQAILVKRIKEKLKEVRTVRLPGQKLDGMPRTQMRCTGLEEQMARVDELERLLAKETAERGKTERQARKSMEGLKTEQYAFCALYYLAGMTIEETAETMCHSERQCWRIKREIERETS